MDTQSLLESFGYLIIFISVFIECGVIIGLVLPLPGFSLLVTAGVLAANHKMDLSTIIVVGTLAATAGYIVGYFTGAHYGRRLFYEKSTSKYFTVNQGQATEKFMKKYGYRTLIFGRFLPIVHNIAPMLSGVAKTPLLPFMAVNVVGSIIWVSLSTYTGYFLGKSIPNLQYYIIPLVIFTMVMLNGPAGRHLLARLTKKIEGL